MACNVPDLIRIQELRASKAIPESPKIMELGSNDLNISSRDEVDQVNAIIKNLTNGQGKRFEVEQAPCPVPARKFYDCLGWEYFCLDVDQRPGTLHIDLNSGGFDARYKGYFDVVTNHGTTEHVINPIASFFVVHELTKSGGIMIHDTPLFGMGNHGFVDLTPKFWHTMSFFNEYEILEGNARSIDPKLIDAANFYLPHLGFIKGLEDIAFHGAIITVVFRKPRGDVTYLPPLDMWPGMTGTVLGGMLYEATKLYLQTDLVSLDELIRTINRFLERNIFNKRLAASQPGALLGSLSRCGTRTFPLITFTDAEGREAL